MVLGVASSVAIFATFSWPLTLTVAFHQPIRPWITRQSSPTRSHEVSQLYMAFTLKEGQTTNMFDGPASLIQERDACGVGFIVNTQHGGMFVNEPKKVKTRKNEMIIIPFIPYFLCRRIRVTRSSATRTCSIDLYGT